jgi:ABC-type transport system involved in cytochrome c biogenesis permease subunit
MKPFTVELLKFEHDRYQGTSVAKNYASTVRLLDPENGVDREERIAMNEPLRYRGVTMYQSGVLPGDSGTVLQVVKNPSWLIPYIACSVISIGMFIHFVIGLRAFLGRKKPPTTITSTGIVSVIDLAAPWVVVALAATYLGFKSFPPSPGEEEINYRAIGNLPILDGGRVKPLDSLARSSLLTISSRQEWFDSNKVSRPAIEWLVHVLDAPDAETGLGAEAKIFRIEHEDLLKLFDLPRRPGSYRYSLQELLPKMQRFRQELSQAEDRAELVKRKKLKQTHEDELRDNKLVELNKKIGVYSRVMRGVPFADPEFNQKRPRLIPPSNPDGEWSTLNQIDESIQFSTDEIAKGIDSTTERVARELKADGIDINTVPQEKLLQYIRNESKKDLLHFPSPNQRATVNEAAGLFTFMLNTAKLHSIETNPERRRELAKDCNEAVEKLQKFYETVPSKKLVSSNLESYLGHTNIFFYAGNLYVFVILLGCLSWLGWSLPLRRGAFYLAMFASLVHGLALVARIYISERPPVTNLYGTAIFIGWACMEICLLLEMIFKNGIGTVAGGVLGAATAMIAHHLSESGDTLDVLQAVLDTNFWLAVHVLTVTMGYVATLVLGIIAIIYLIAGVFTPTLDKSLSKTLGMMMYGTCCFAMLLSFFGTTSGGIWGDQSWGRFWGWDPKENGAVLVVIWNALILHARWCGLIKERGMAILALMGNMVTFWSWFGTNQLGVGLHAYGFNPTLAEMCMWVWLGHIFLIGLGMMPLEWWSSYSTLMASSAPPVVASEVANATPANPMVVSAVNAPSLPTTQPDGGPKPNGKNEGGGKKKKKNRR